MSGTALGQIQRRRLVVFCNRLHERRVKMLASTVKDARKIGDVLLQLKGSMPHGRWLPFLKGSITFSRSQAATYMRIAENWHAVNESESIRQATLLLAEPDDGPREEAEPRAPERRAGGRVAVAEPLVDSGWERCYVALGSRFEAFVGENQIPLAWPERHHVTIALEAAQTAWLALLDRMQRENLALAG